MIKYKIIGRKPNKSQNNEVEEYLRDKDFMKVLLLTLTYYIQGYHGDYGFSVQKEGDVNRITVTLY